MRVGVYFSGVSANSGGAHTFERGILKELESSSAGHEVFVFSPNQIEINNQNVQLKFIRIDSINFKNQTLKGKVVSKLYSLFKIQLWKKQFLSPLDELLHKNKVDLIWFATQYWEKVNIPYIYTVWDLNHRVMPCFPEVGSYNVYQLRENWSRACIPRATYVLTGTSVGKVQIAKYYAVDEDRIKVIPFFAPDLESITSSNFLDIKAKYSLNTPYIFYPATYHPHKNHFVLLEAIKLLKENYSRSITAVFVGFDPGNKKYLVTQAANMGISNLIRFIDFVSINELVTLYKNAVALTFAAFLGPDNIPPLESFLLRCPLICYNYLGAPEILENKCILVKENDPHEWADAIVKVSDDVKFKSTMVSTAYDFVRLWRAKQYVGEVMKLISKFTPIRNTWRNSNV